MVLCTQGKSSYRVKIRAIKFICIPLLHMLTVLPDGVAHVKAKEQFPMLQNQ